VQVLQQDNAEELAYHGNYYLQQVITRIGSQALGEVSMQSFHLCCRRRVPFARGLFCVLAQVAKQNTAFAGVICFFPLFLKAGIILKLTAVFLVLTLVEIPQVPHGQANIMPCQVSPSAWSKFSHCGFRWGASFASSAHSP